MPTKRNSDLIMVDRLVEEKEPVSAEIILRGKVDNLTNSEWKLAEGYRIILMSFEQGIAIFVENIILRYP